MSKSASTNMEDLGIRAAATIVEGAVTGPMTIASWPTNPTLTIPISDRPDHPFRAYAQIVLRFDDEELAFTPERFLDALKRLKDAP